MKIFKSFNQLAKGIGKSYLEIEESWDMWLGRSYMHIGDVEVMKHIKDNELHFVVFNNEDDEECRQYMMQYEIHEYEWCVYVDDIEKWQSCRVINIENTRMGIDRATVICESGTQVNRIVKFVIDREDEDFQADRCIYFYEAIEER